MIVYIFLITHVFQGEKQFFNKVSGFGNVLNAFSLHKQDVIDGRYALQGREKLMEIKVGQQEEILEELV